MNKSTKKRTVKWMKRFLIVGMLLLVFWSLGKIKSKVDIHKQTAEVVMNTNNEQAARNESGSVLKETNYTVWHADILFFEIIIIVNCYLILVVLDYQPRKLSKDYYGVKM